VAQEPKIAEFVEKALAAGIPAESLVGVLKAQGWPEKDVYNALAEHYQRVTGVSLPRHGGAGTSAKEAFFYLLMFATLATWTIGLGSLAFALINRWLPDPLTPGYQQALDTYTITTSLAAILVAYPLYMLISRIVVRDTAAHPEKLDSGIRKWLTYMALVVAAGIFMGDLIAALSYLLRGELTSRFIAKSFVVLALSGGVFYYYFGGLRRTEGDSTGVNRDWLMAVVSAAVVALMVALGFSQSGAPREQRTLRADSQRVYELYQLSVNIHNYWQTHGSQLPTDLDQVPASRMYRTDPVTHAPYEYHPGTGNQYTLCATFAERTPEGNAYGPDIWVHPAGRYCFAMNAAGFPSSPPQPMGEY